MKNGFRALLVYGFALTAMAYAVWQGGHLYTASRISGMD